MSKVRLDQDICPLSEFRAAVASFVRQIQQARRPLVLTQRGRGVAVLVDVHEFERLQERLEVFEDACLAEKQLAPDEDMSRQDASLTADAQ